MCSLAEVNFNCSPIGNVMLIINLECVARTIQFWIWYNRIRKHGLYNAKQATVREEVKKKKSIEIQSTDSIRIGCKL